MENEEPAKAEELFRELAAKVEDDPLPQADLAIALLRQQKIDKALTAIRAAREIAQGTQAEMSSGRADLMAIEAEILQWAGQEDEALGLLRQAVRKAPEDLEIVYALYRLASTLQDDRAKSSERQALEQLARLRPENTVVLSALGRRAIDRGDRTAATGAYLRLEELAWQGPAAMEQTLDRVLEALEKNELENARVPAQRLENVLKITPMYQQSLRELTLGIQGVPVQRFAAEPAPTGFGAPAEISWRARREGGPATPSTGPSTLAALDLDGDGRPDPVRLVAPSGGGRAVEVRWSTKDEPTSLAAPAGAVGVLVTDLDNDGLRDVLAYGPGASGNSGAAAFWRGDGKGGLTAATGELGLAGAGGTAAAVLDFDIEGDLDLAVFGGRGSGKLARLYRNNLQGALEEVGGQSFPETLFAEIESSGAHQSVASDLDRDGDLDLLVAQDGGLLLLDNLRQGRFADRSWDSGLRAPGVASPTVRAVASADLDNDGRPDLVTAPEAGGIVLWHNLGDRFGAWALDQPSPKDTGKVSAVVPLDADHDGRLDLALATAAGVGVWLQRGDVEGSGGTAARFEARAIQGPEGGFGTVTGLAAADADGDGDLDLFAAGDRGLFRVENVGGNEKSWLQVQLRGLSQGNSKNNVLGAGSTVEIFAGSAYQFRESDGGVVHFGLGSVRKPDAMRVTWTNGVPQNRLQPQTDQVVAEEQVLKGSCPFLYAWDGEGYRFVTDLLWGAPTGLPLAPGVWAPADPEELVRVDGIRAEGDTYRLAITEELWEAAFFDRVRLWVVDHPADVEVASDLRIVPGETVPPERWPDRVLGTRELQPMAAAWDGRGEDVTREVSTRDEVYADGYTPSRYQGVATEPWTFTFDLGEAPAAPVRLHLDGWIFPTDASLNLALAQRSDPVWMPPRLEVETADGWQVLMANPGFPAGKTKTLVLDTPPLPEGARRLRLVTTLWLHWDRIAWSRTTADDAPRVVARLDPASAELRYRGFSQPVRTAPNAPHRFDYTHVRKDSPWLPFPGRYTRYGDVRELLTTADDRSVILGAGDAMELIFDVSNLPEPTPGWRRTVFLESQGWDKDADRNTWEPDQVEPLPFRAMSGYPYGDGESFPDTPVYREYREKWLTRVVGGDR